MSASERGGAAELRAAIEGWDRLAIAWRLDPGERTLLLGVPPGGDVARPESYGADFAEDRMRRLVALGRGLKRVMRTDARIRGWLRRPNANLAGRTPIEAMATSPEWVRWLAEAIEVAS